VGKTDQTGTQVRSIYLTGGRAVISILITLLVLCLIFGLVWWIITLIPLPAPFGRVAQVIVAVIFLIIVIYMLLPLAGHPLLR
jgi:hypothetical protein